MGDDQGPEGHGHVGGRNEGNARHLRMHPPWIRGATSQRAQFSCNSENTMVFVGQGLGVSCPVMFHITLLYIGDI